MRVRGRKHCTAKLELRRAYTSTYLAKVRRVPRRVVLVREVLRVYELAFREPCVQEPSVISELRVCLFEGEGGGYGATVSGAKVLVDGR